MNNQNNDKVDAMADEEAPAIPDSRVIDEILYDGLQKNPEFLKLDALIEHPIESSRFGSVPDKIKLIDIVGSFHIYPDILKKMNEVHRGVSAFISKLETGVSCTDISYIKWHAIITALKTTMLSFTCPETAEGQRLLHAWNSSPQGAVAIDWGSILDKYLLFAGVYDPEEISLLRAKIILGPQDWLQNFGDSLPLRQKDIVAEIQKFDMGPAAACSTSSLAQKQKKDRQTKAADSIRSMVKIAVKAHNLNVAKRPRRKPTSDDPIGQ